MPRDMQFGFEIPLGPKAVISSKQLHAAIRSPVCRLPRRGDLRRAASEKTQIATELEAFLYLILLPRRGSARADNSPDVDTALASITRCKLIPEVPKGLRRSRALRRLMMRALRYRSASTGRPCGLCQHPTLNLPAELDPRNAKIH